MEPISAAHHAAPTMKAAQKTVRRTHRGNTGTLFTWLLDGADDATVRGRRREVPRPVLYVITRTSGRRYRRTVSSAAGLSGRAAHVRRTTRSCHSPGTPLRA